MSAASEAINASLVAAVLTMRATVYTRAGNAGFTVVSRADLPCRLDPLDRSPAATGPARRELAAMGTLRYDATYEMPESGIQIEVDAYPGKRWTPVAATNWPDVVPGVGTIGKTVEVVRA